MSSKEKQQSAQAAADLEAKVQKAHSVDSVVVKRKCPQCNYANDAEDIYCAECGALLRQPAKCPQCGAMTQPRADICEVCGAWLLKGQCMFCYAHIDEDDIFCGECGNPIAGITCPRCSKISIFDFCPSCGIPLSLQAKEMVRETAKDPAFQEMVSLFAQFSTAGELSVHHAIEPECTAPVAEAKSPRHDEQALQLKAYRESSPKSSPGPKTGQGSRVLFSNDQKERISRLTKEVAQEEERRRIEEERRRQEEERKRREAEERRRREETLRQEKARKLREQLNETMHKFSGKTFSSSQEARRFFMNIIAGLSEEVAKNIINSGRLGWRCNAYDCVHDSPAQCADPSRGGVWLIR